MTYSSDLRERVIRFHKSQEHPKVSHTANIFQVSVSTVRRWVNGFVLQQRSSPKLCLVLPIVKEMVERKPFMTYHQMRQEMIVRYRVKVSIGTLFNALRQLKISRKKVVERKIYGSLERILEKREQFCRDFIPSVFNRALSIDETHFYSHSAPRYGYSKVGKRILRHCKNTNENYSCVMAMDSRRIVGWKIYKGG